jgi:DNA polymerase III delta subunit
MTVFSAGKPWEQAKNAVARTIGLAAEAKLKFAPGAAELFVSRVGTDSRSLMSELSKMRDFLGTQRDTVTVKDIGELTSQGVGVEPEVWSITDAIGERDTAKAVEAVRRFEQESGFAVLVTTVVEKFFRQLAELKDAQLKGVFDEAVEGMNPYAVKKNTAFLGNWTLFELRLARGRFLRLRERAVSSSGSADVLVMTELVRTLRRARR